MAKTHAEHIAKQQKEISIAEFFTKNRHLLGFDSQRKAILIAVKEAVDNALDACQEANILPDITVELKPVKGKDDRLVMVVEDNGPGIVKKHIGNVFGKLLFGSKFHRLNQSLTADEPILIKRENKIEVIPIGELIDQKIAKEGDIRVDNIQVPSFDPKTYKYTFRTASHLIKHKRANPIHEITTQYGKKIKVTGCHSLFTVDKETLEVKEIEAKNIKEKDIILAPKKIEVEQTNKEINILEYIDKKYAKKRYWYFYTEKEKIKEIFTKAEIIHKKKAGDKSRKYYRLKSNQETVDILDDSYKQYIKKGFIPVWLAKSLNLDLRGVIRTYRHGKKYNIQTHWPLTPNLMKLLGLYVAEGHPDKRQVGFTFGNHERDLIHMVCNTAHTIGLGYTIEERPEKNSTRVKLFGGVISYLFKEWCGHGAKNKRVPPFVFTAPEELRQDFIDYLHEGDGHKTKNKNELTLSTTSKKLANEVAYLWLMSGITAGISKTLKQGLGKKPSISYIVAIHGDNLNKSNLYNASGNARKAQYKQSITSLAKRLGKRFTYHMISYFNRLNEIKEKEITKEEFATIFTTEKVGYKLRILEDKGLIQKNTKTTYSITKQARMQCEEFKKIEKLITSDFLFLPVKRNKKIEEGHDYVYDISVPERENFVGGFGGLSCHNSRGQQGIGISAAVLYGQLTTGKNAIITSKISPKHPAHHYELHLDTQRNHPNIVKDTVLDWAHKKHGTRIEIEMQAKYQKGKQSVDEYVKQTAIANPFASITYINPLQEKTTFPRATKELPKEAKEIKPHPYGIELGMFMRMAIITSSATLKAFLQKDFSRVSSTLAANVCKTAKISVRTRPQSLSREQAESIYNALQKEKIMAPPTDCLSPIGEETLLSGIKKEINADFYATCTRKPTVYRGNPFQIEVGIAYGGDIPSDKTVKIMRIANRVPLLYQEGAGAIKKSVTETAWKNYGLQQSRGNVPAGPAIIVVHMASVWVPFTSESKEAVAHYDEIIKEMKLAIQECGRKLAKHIRQHVRAAEQRKKAQLFEKFIPELATTLAELSGESKQAMITGLEKRLKKRLPEILGQAK